MGFPLLPGATIEPDLERQPLLANFLDGAKYGVGTDPVRAMRIGEIAGHIDLRRLQPLQESDNVGDVLRMNGRLGDGPGAVEAQVHELQLLRG